MLLLPLRLYPKMNLYYSLMLKDEVDWKWPEAVAVAALLSVLGLLIIYLCLVEVNCKMPNSEKVVETKGDIIHWLMMYPIRMASLTVVRTDSFL